MDNGRELFSFPVKHPSILMSWELMIPIYDWFISMSFGRREFSHKQFTRRVLRIKSQELVPKIQTSSNSWAKSQGPNFGHCN